jgi:hypothetical protein
MTANDDKTEDQPTAGIGDVDETSRVADSPRTGAAEQHSEPPTDVDEMLMEKKTGQGLWP